MFKSICVHMNKFKKLRRLWGGFIIAILLWFIWLAVEIVNYVPVHSHASADVAIVLGAAVWQGEPSPVFAERIKHAIHLYEIDQVKWIIFTGGVGEGDSMAESEVARDYALAAGVPAEAILIETHSRITIENLMEACAVMQDVDANTAVIVSDPLHMKRAMDIALHLGMDAAPSPTPTSRYQTWRSQTPSLVYETFFLSLHTLNHRLGGVEPC